MVLPLVRIPRFWQGNRKSKVVHTIIHDINDFVFGFWLSTYAKAMSRTGGAAGEEADAAIAAQADGALVESEWRTWNCVDVGLWLDRAGFSQHKEVRGKPMRCRRERLRWFNPLLSPILHTGLPRERGGWGYVFWT